MSIKCFNSRYKSHSKHAPFNKHLSEYVRKAPIAVAAMSKMWVCGRLLVGTAGSNSAEVMDVCLSLVSVVFCQVEVSAMG
jgi:hypothetical protein